MAKTTGRPVAIQKHAFLTPQIIPSQTFGNSVATHCIDCEHPLLFVLRKQQGIGRTPDTATVCSQCQKKYYMTLTPAYLLLNEL